MAWATRRWPALITCFVVPATCVAIWSMRDGSRRGTDQTVESDAERTVVARVSDPDLGYVGNEVCVNCHAEIAALYRTSGMSRSWTGIASHLSQFGEIPQQVTSPSDGLRYRVSVSDDSIVQQETAADGSEEAGAISRSAGHAVGSGTRAVAFVREDHGYLYQMPVAWFAKSGWSMSPGYEIHNQRFDRQVTQSCVACHAGPVPVTSGDPAGRFAHAVVSGITCERCHGPGRSHVDDQKDPGRQPSASEPKIVNPADLESALALDVCLQCHLQGDVYIYAPERHAGTFRPGQKLSDHRLDFLIDSDRNDEIGIASHGTRMMRSPCFQESQGTMTCVTCHDPHASVRAQGRESFNSRCLNCHQDGCTSPKISSSTTSVADCVSCHMPRLATREGIHVVVTDHWIVREPAQDDGTGRSLMERLTPNADLSLNPIWPQADPTGTRLGEAYLRLHEAYGPQLPSLRKGLTQLAPELNQPSAGHEILRAAGIAQITIGQAEAGIKLLERAVAKHPDDAEARFQLGMAYDRAARQVDAIHQLELAIELSPDWLEPYPWLARARMSRGEFDLAERVLEHQLQKRPDASTCVNMAVLQVLRGRPHSAAMSWVEKALQIDPRLPQAKQLKTQLQSSLHPMPNR